MSRRPPPRPPAGAESLAALAALADPVRRGLYRFVVKQGETGRDAAARAAGVSRALAAFHLDKLVAAGLLEADFRRPRGRRGPGAGRPAKRYRRARGTVEISLPARRYELAARILAEAVAASRAPALRRTLRAAARREGRALGAAARAAAPAPRTARRLAHAAFAALAAQGYEPARDAAGVIRLRNCPFHALAERRRDLVCGMNLALLDGLVGGLGGCGLAASLEPKPGWCCVAFRPAGG